MASLSFPQPTPPLLHTRCAFQVQRAQAVAHLEPALAGCRREGPRAEENPDGPGSIKAFSTTAFAVRWLAAREETWDGNTPVFTGGYGGPLHVQVAPFITRKPYVALFAQLLHLVAVRRVVDPSPPFRTAAQTAAQRHMP
jgi:hypothetical protein